MDTQGICWRRREFVDGGENALVVFNANVLAMTDGREITATDTCCGANLIAGDVQAATFGAEEVAEVLVALTKLHCLLVFLC